MRSWQLRNFLSPLNAGLIAGLLEVALAASFASLIFSGELSGYVSRGIGLALMGAFLLETVDTLEP